MKITQKMLMGIFIVGIMVLSVFGFVLSYRTQDTNVLDYNGIAFRQTAQGWQADISGKQRTFVFHPLELGTLTLGEDASALLSARAIAISYDNTAADVETLGQAQYYIEQQSGDARTLIRGVTTSTSTLPQITCDQATADQPVIILAIDNGSTSTESHCIRVHARDTTQLVQYADVINYNLLGVYNGR